MLSRDTGRVRYTLLWPYDLALNHLDEHWWHQSGQYAVCTNITADLSMGVVVEYPGVGVAEEPGGLPRKLDLDVGGPSPFRGVTRLRYSLPEPAHVRLLVYDASGRLVRTLRSGQASSGLHHADWDGRDSRGATVARGLYFCRLAADDERMTRKLVRLR